MIRRRIPAPREKISILLAELEEFLRLQGPLGAEEACRRILRIREIPAALAPRLLRTALDGDSRFRVAGDGSVGLASRAMPPSIPLGDTVFTVVDLETTGGWAEQDRILEVGAVRVERGAAVREFSTLLNPEAPIAQFVAYLTGIRDEMVATAPRFAEIAETLLEFLGDSTFVAHNLPFDLGFLNRELVRYSGFVLANPTLCTVRLGRRLLPDLPDRRLDTLAHYYGILIEDRHRALGDARATATLLVRMIGDLAERGIERRDQLEEFLAPVHPPRRGEELNGTRRMPRMKRHSPPSAGS
jgi:DNA polymerase III epsilon subunit family exonuclease